MGKGEWGEGFTGATIKDTWAKSRGRVEAGEGGGIGWGGVEGWGENAEKPFLITRIRLGPLLHCTRLTVL